MPTRPTIVLILVGWVVAAAGLFHRDILPEFRNTPPPDLRSVAGANDDATPTTWFLSVADDAGLKSLRPVGRAYTRTEHRPDGTTVLISNVSFDSNGMLRGTPFAPRVEESGPEGHVTIHNSCEVDPSGNLRQFRVKVYSTADTSAPLLTIDARNAGRTIEATVRGPYPWLNRPVSIPYEPRGLVQNGIGPVDRLPGLQVGQRWRTEVVNPMTGIPGTALTEVTGKHSIFWNNTSVSTLEVLQKLSPGAGMPEVAARTWVRPDGLVLRQEVPLPFVRLILERAPATVAGGPANLGSQAP